MPVKEGLVEVTFAIDESGLLKVTAYNRIKKTTIDHIPSSI